MSKPKGKRQIKVTVLYGLPASGKTFFAKKHPASSVVDFDEIIRSHKTNKFAIMSALSKAFGSKLHRRTNAIIIDGLVTTNQQLRDIIDSLTASFADYQLVFELVYWKEDRDACLHNDKNRREVSSELSIKNLPYETPNLQLFPELSQKRVQAMKVVRKSPSLAWIAETCRKLEYSEWQVEQMLDSKQLTSESWCLGGTWGSYTGDSGTVDAEAPLEFVEFDRILEVVCPNIGFLAYKKLKAKCCRLETKSSGDYYGGHTTSAYHVCDLQALFDSLIELNLIKSDPPVNRCQMIGYGNEVSLEEEIELRRQEEAHQHEVMRR